MSISTVTGDLLEQPTEAIVNPWNQNVLPWWLLVPHGVSGAIKRRAGVAPFRELARSGGGHIGRALAVPGDYPCCEHSSLGAQFGADD